MPRPRTKNPRNNQLNLHFTAAEIGEIKARAEALGMRPVAFGRTLLLSGGIVNQPNTEAAAAKRGLMLQLARLGNNLNQIVRRCHIRNDPLPPDLEPLLADVRALFARESTA